MKYANVLMVAIAVTMAPALVRAESFSTNVSSFWAESYTDASGTYHSPAPSSTSVVGGQLVAPLLTDGNPNFPYNEVDNYVRTRFDLPGASAAYAGSLLGNLSGKAALTATFSLNNSTLGANAPFLLSQLVGDGIPPGSGPPVNPGLRLVFTGTALVDANGAGDTGEPNEWWSNPTGASVTSLNNGQDVTLTVDFDPSVWSNIDGLVGTNPLVAGQFQAALSNVSLLGISFGSGDFFSDGFSFNTGGTASLNIDSISTIPAPLPASAGIGFSMLAGFGALFAVRKRMSRKARIA